MINKESRIRKWTDSHYGSPNPEHRTQNPELRTLNENKKSRYRGTVSMVAESQGFEPREAYTSTVFKTAAIDRSANSPGQR